jgi:hypothetical protein
MPARNIRITLIRNQKNRTNFATRIGTLPPTGRVPLLPPRFRFRHFRENEFVQPIAMATSALGGRLAAVQAVVIISGLGLFLALAGCVGYVQGDGGVEVVEPDMFMFGGYSDGAPARDYGRRGGESRGGAGRSAARPAAQPAAQPGGRGRR